MSQTATKPLQIVRFASKHNESNFFDDLKRQVDAYFAQTGVDKRANWAMMVKTVVMFSIYLAPYALLLSGLAAGNPWLFFGCWVMMAAGMVGIGTSVMHDSNHGAYTNNKKVGEFIGGAIHLIGGYDRTWKIQHNILHHTYTNLEGLDHDLEAGALLRFHRAKKKLKVHQYQHWYAWFLYGLLTINWCTAKDYKALVNYEKNGLLRKTRVTLREAVIELSAIRVIYFIGLLALPTILSGFSFGLVLLGFLLMHFIAGLALSCIFQLAHVMEECEFPEPSAANRMENSWAIHQLNNTVNFAPKSRLMSWFIGGLNFQIEHHLFPTICHVHYKKLSPLIAQTAEKHGLQYYIQPTFVKALWLHSRMLKSLGR